MREVYWDRGPQMIKIFMEQHGAACGSNWICNGLHLATTEVQDEKLITPKKAQPKTAQQSGPLRIGQLSVDLVTSVTASSNIIRFLPIIDSRRQSIFHFV
jgi:hypothetical protein